jgi:rhodanese-related sulfurtransferase
MKHSFNIALSAFLIVFGIAGIVGAAQDNPRPIDIKTIVAMMNKSQKMIIIDARSALECMDSKIPGALCSSCDEEKGALLPQDAAKDTPVIFYGGSIALTTGCKAIAAAQKQGFNDLRILRGGFAAWRKAEGPVQSERRIPRIMSRALNPKKLSEWQKRADRPLVIDIRSQSAYAKDHIDGALNFPLTKLPGQYVDIPLGRALLIVDEDETESFLATGYLARKGFVNIQRLRGGMTEYRRGAK